MDRRDDLLREAERLAQRSARLLERAREAERRAAQRRTERDYRRMMEEVEPSRTTPAERVSRWFGL